MGVRDDQGHPESPRPPGRPYYQWTAKLDGRTVTRRLDEGEAKLYQGWVANDRRMRRLIQQMREVATKATDLKLKEATNG